MYLFKEEQLELSLEMDQSRETIYLANTLPTENFHKYLNPHNDPEQHVLLFLLVSWCTDTCTLKGN